MPSPLVFPQPAIDGKTFADAAARLAGAVAIASWQADGPEGLLVRAVSLLSTRPARVLFGVAKGEAGHDRLLHADTCALNVLSDIDEAEAQRFEQSGAADRFSPVRWRLDAGRPPRLTAAAVHLSGVIDQKIDAGSHSVFIVRVDTVEVRDQAPLVSFDRGFRRLAQSSQSAGAQVCAMLEA